ncbi:MAG: sigma-70 family RNA polymerase sigma factor [Ruminococcaceae bacterium]|nr:sigma-70 family RNA polymerase sigma factor [Oscillospiraceae bacterium]
MTTKGGTTAVKNTLFNDYQGPRLPRQVQLKRVKNVIEQELTPLQRETVLAYYFQGLNICQIAQERGVNKSTVCRTLHRAEKRLQRCLRY